MDTFDHDFVSDVMERLGQLKPDACPKWGAMTPHQMIVHLSLTLLYVMGRKGRPMDRSNWFSRKIIAPLFINGIVPIPKNIKAPGTEPRPLSTTFEEDLESLRRNMEEYLTLAETGALVPHPHPMFGEIGVDGWAKLHVHHTGHHLRQFGV